MFSRLKIGVITISLLLTALLSVNIAVAAPKSEKSDLNSDRIVDILDLTIFSENYLEKNWETVQWCDFYNATVAGEHFDGNSTKYYLKNFKLLLSFINSYFRCDVDPDPDPDMLTLENEPRYLYRIAKSTDGSGDYYITDGKVNSLFFYDFGMVLKAEIKGLAMPLGVAVDSLGYILVGNDGRDNIEVFDSTNGNLVALFGEGLLQMPNAITIGPQGNIYVTDSRKNSVLVFDTDYNYLRSIGASGVGDGELNFPVDTEIIARNDGGTTVYDVFVADQSNHRIQIFDTEGNFLETITSPADSCGYFGECNVPEFIRLQGLSSDSLGRLHVLDAFAASVFIFDSSTIEHLGTYSEYGEGPGTLKLPGDVLISGTDKSIITSGHGSGIEVLTFE
jgi:hypothetical protein